MLSPPAAEPWVQPSASEAVSVVYEVLLTQKPPDARRSHEERLAPGVGLGCVSRTAFRLGAIYLPAHLAQSLFTWPLWLLGARIRTPDLRRAKAALSS